MPRDSDGFNYADYVDALKSLRENYVEGYTTELEFRKELRKLAFTATEIEDEVRERNAEKASSQPKET
jgi:hypothetical protein